MSIGKYFLIGEQAAPREGNPPKFNPAKILAGRFADLGFATDLD
jgi:hypothetical protein